MECFEVKERIQKASGFLALVTNWYHSEIGNTEKQDTLSLRCCCKHKGSGRGRGARHRLGNHRHMPRAWKRSPRKKRGVG